MYVVHLCILATFSLSLLHLLVLGVSVLYCAHPCMKSSADISNFIEEISSLSPSIVFLYFFALFTKEGFLISPCYFLELCIQMGIFSLSPLLFASLLFSAIYKAPSDKHLAFLHFFFLGIILVTASCTMLPTSVHSSSGTLSTRSNPLNLLCRLHRIAVRDLI